MLLKMSVGSEASSATSVGEQIDAGNPRRDLLADGIVSILKPTIDQIDDKIKLTRFGRFQG